MARQPLFRVAGLPAPVVTGPAAELKTANQLPHDAECGMIFRSFLQWLGDGE